MIHAVAPQCLTVLTEHGLGFCIDSYKLLAAMP